MKRHDRVAVCIFAPYLGEGGVDRMLVNLAKGFWRKGVSVHFLTSQSKSPYLSLLPQPLMRKLKGQTSKEITGEVAEYLEHENPTWLLTAKDNANAMAFQARVLSRKTTTKLAFRVGTTISVKYQESFVFFLKRYVRLRQIRQLYNHCDLLIAVSKGAADDLQRLMGTSSVPIATLHNPVVSDDIFMLGRGPIGHRWFDNKDCPVILGAGGFRRSKDFPTLIRAFAIVREKMPCRLVILGRGRQEKTMRAIAKKLGILEDIDFPGFVSNPYPYMAAAGVFVLSSRWEGSPNVVVEALALGTPVVSTDCKSGPREILANGYYGALVPVGDHRSMAQAIIQTLRSPCDSDMLREASKPYTVEASVKEYIEALGIGKDE